MEFPAFPYEPYPIQIDFMRALYRYLDKGGVSMLESPTGTGKTLSIICSSLQWLIDKRQQEAKCESEKKSDQNGSCESDGEPDWMKNFCVDKGDKPVVKYNLRENGSKLGLNKYVKRDLNSASVYTLGKSVEEVMRKAEDLVKSEEALENDDFLLDEYESDDELGIDGGRPKRKAGDPSISSSSDEEEDKDVIDDEGGRDGLKIYFCSRTHSQLSQFIKELKKTNFASEIRVVCLGSRKNFCINEEVLKLGSSTRINEKCLDLMKNTASKTTKVKNSDYADKKHKTKASCGCPMLRKQKLQKQFRKEVSEQGVMDIEDLVILGRNIGACPYYGSRSMVPTADLVVLPYQSLLSKSTRESLGLSLRNNIIIIDEAHNLADSLISMYDAKVTSLQLERVQSRLEGYFSRFCNLLGPGNRRYVQTLLILTRAFLKALHEEETFVSPFQDRDNNSSTPAKVADSTFSINDFLFSINIDNINLVKLLRYMKESNIIHKVSGYGDKVKSSTDNSTVSNFKDFVDDESTISGFQALVNMLHSLTNNDCDGRMIVSKIKRGCIGQTGYIKYVMLTGEKIFSEIADQAHAVVLAGGTLQPIEETRERLFPKLSFNQLQFFSCSHIIPPESILPISISHGPSGHSFDFSFNSRSLPIMVEELGLLLCNIVTVVPEGIVVFFSSFDYEALVYRSWKESGILERIMKKKHIFREPRKNTDIEGVLQEYKETIDKLSNKNLKENSHPCNGAMLLAVVGGKISEGINFSDGMGRCIVMVGLPYPNPSDIELIERIKHIEGLGESNVSKSLGVSASHICNSGDGQIGFHILRNCKRRGKEYYENLCMKAVNQSIGRAIRHIDDYAAILLVDSRYATNSSTSNAHHPTNKLPQWIKDRLVSTTSNYGEVHRLLHQFFKFNKNRGHK
uniref:Helicase ATP-binding domain-containing protein n=1 Tax=Kalanchoe fedtschenkoi TaxID=63787 RepID=A0A7N0UY48_KALFE